MIHFEWIDVILFAMAYLLGSIPTSVWVGKWFYHIDLREHGSGNAGTTNTIRVLGLKPGLVVFAIDVAKGWLAVSLVHFFNIAATGSNGFYLYSIILGLAAAIGHQFPVLAGFRGGKGVATALGVGIGLHPMSALVTFVFFALCFIIFRIVSLSSMLAGIFYPFVVTFLFHIHSTPMVIFSVFIPVMLVFSHRKNIRRLLNHEEPKFYFRNKPQNSQ